MEEYRKQLPKKLQTASDEEISRYLTLKNRKGHDGGEEARQMFRERMAREGLLEAFVERVAKYRDEGKSRRLANYAAMADFGYQGAVDERKKHRHALALGRFDRRRQQISNGQKRYIKRMRHGPLIEAFNKLPNTAPNKVEVGWVRSHPKMLLAQLEEHEENPTRITLTVEDITSPSNGPCPSKGAFNMLAGWVNDVKEFKKQMIGEQRKASDQPAVTDDEAANVVADDDLGEVERMLKVFRKDA